MKYNLKNDQEHTKAWEYLTDLSLKECLVEIKKISPKRSLNQNSYLHLLLGSFGEHFGYTIEEAKQIYKEINGDLYLYTKKNRHFVRSSADLTKEEMANSIDKFMRASAERGHPLPLATDKEWLVQIENEIEASKHYL